MLLNNDNRAESVLQFVSNTIAKVEMETYVPEMLDNFEFFLASFLV